MWTRTALKKKTRSSMRQNYWKMISVCFIIALLTTAYPVSTTFVSLQAAPEPHISDAAFALNIPNSEVIIQIGSQLLAGTTLFGLFQSTAVHISQLLIDMYSTHISLIFTTLRAVYTFLSEPFGMPVIFSVTAVFLMFLYQVFISNLLLIGEKRFFLENHNYSATKISKIFFLFKLRCLIGPAWIMFCRSLFQGLWYLTIIGGIIKHYEYILIPYILAENPKISRADAFRLSKQLMMHNKWKMFRLDLSFLGLKLLSILTLGFLDFVFVNPYVTGCRTELYLTLRRNYVLSRCPRYEQLNDPYLEHVPSEDELLISKALYDDSQGPYTKISYFAPGEYPVFLFSVQPPFQAVKSPIKADRKYDVRSCIFLFHAFSIFGWIMETMMYLFRDGFFSERSTLKIPWMPLYGIYGILLLLLAKRRHKKPVRVFLISLVLYAVTEYLFNTVSELLLGYPLRDYSEFLMNINGRIYLGGALFFGLLGCAFLYYLAPRWTGYFMKLKPSTRTAMCICLSVLFATGIVLTFLLS